MELRKMAVQTSKSKKVAFPFRKKARYSAFNGFPSKYATHALKDDDWFFLSDGPPRLLGLECTEFAHIFSSNQKNVYGFSKRSERNVRRG